jgi:threonine aldolase
MRIVDFRSDLLTRPTAEMMNAIQAACARPWSFDLREDPDQQALEREIAEILGHEDALLMPTATMANEIALMLHARPGDAVVAPADAHIATSEAGAPAALAGVSLRLLNEHLPEPGAWEDAVRGDSDALRSRIAVLVLENTHNRAGGAAISADISDAIIGIARRKGIATHLDGARLFNAAIAVGVTPARLARDFDTVCISLNKGLGAPIGAALAGSRRLVAQALVIRQRLGGGIRPTALLAAAARAAFASWHDLADDHARAARLTQALDQLPGFIPMRPTQPTNIVIAQVAKPVSEVVAALAARDVLVLPFGPGRIRFVVYRGITDADVAQAVAACAEIAAGGDGATP